MSKVTMEDDSNYPILVNRCPALVNKFCTIKYKRTTDVLKLFGCGMFRCGL